MKIKKQLVLIVILLLIMGLTNLRTQQQEGEINKLPIEKIATLPIINSNGNYIQYENFDTLKQHSELIIIAKATEEFEHREHVNTFHETPEDNYQPKMLIDGITKTNVHIKKILKQPEDAQLNEGDLLTVIEPITIFEDVDHVKKIMTISHYQAIGMEDTILFLTKNSYGVYGVINMNNGHYSLTKTDELDTTTKRSASEERERTEDFNQHQTIKETIVKTYRAEINEVQDPS
ncbi:hypothetical protein [Lysinibacillus sp. 38-6]|uniref:hypothetical protein n=1 Tax=Lysinibacillus sp. 38-6 TaxID=3385991 RepID=UPI003908BBFF